MLYGYRRRDSTFRQIKCELFSCLPSFRVDGIALTLPASDDDWDSVYTFKWQNLLLVSQEELELEA
jgi:hypothetical protein